MLLALTDPSLVREKREPQKTVVAVVLDRSESQNFGARIAQTEEARKALETALAKFGDVETALRRRRAMTPAAMTAPSCSARWSEALKDVPPERVGGAMLVTDGVVHDIPAKADALGFKAPVHALVTGQEGERDRRIELVEAPRFGIVGKEQTIRARVVDTGGDGAPRRRSPCAATASSSPTYSPVPGDIVNIPVRIEHGGANIVELEVPPAPGELTLARQQGGA